MKYPIVLVHGLGAVDKSSLIHFWGRIPEVLRHRGHPVVMGNTDAWGGYESNAEILKNTVDQVLTDHRVDKVNLLAHSKGGLDSRFFLWHYGYGPRVASLVTVCTPHRGAELADFFLKQKPMKAPVARKLLKVFGSLFLDQHPDPYQALQDLSTEGMKNFNERVTLDPQVYFKSYYSSMRHSRDDPLLFFTHRYLKRIAGRNDGIVTEASAAWGPDREELKGRTSGLSHVEMIDFKRKPISGIEVPDLYLRMVKELEQRGF